MKNKIKAKENKIILKSDQVENICMCSEDYFQFYKIKSLQELLEPNTERYKIQSGFYGTMLEKKIWVQVGIPQGYIKVFPLGEIPVSSKDESWSINIRISEFEKMMKLKFFW
jgi:hypothetical protein